MSRCVKAYYHNYIVKGEHDSRKTIFSDFFQQYIYSTDSFMKYQIQVSILDFFCRSKGCELT